MELVSHIVPILLFRELAQSLPIFLGQMALASEIASDLATWSLSYPSIERLQSTSHDFVLSTVFHNLTQVCLQA